MYQSVKADNPKTINASMGTSKPSEVASGEEEVSGLKYALESLRAEAAIRSDRNRKLLNQRMAALRSEIKNLKSTYARRNFESNPTPSLIDIKG